ncbi:threonine and homoserine efflux system [Sporomusa ovata DSM 2662]|uniref:Permease of the drug/metabolite transporter (DMT) superfamily n=1 Tax=Sporomusa ovata TaxID=2378 RepID=A0A0U1KSF8_9FIRM|nr:DMT family transporter [Sporomusa ovata]EQB26282.1 EamA-like drug/metabolite transporter [Sporomusa ovata DSM 2662]CQR70358.1 Permease of the drug/metabolite transporter (DMT) superfamily [Sporomusa ovata]
MNPQYTGALLVAASAAGFATLAIFIKFAYAAGASMITILAGRFVLAAICLPILLKWRGISLMIDKALLLRLALLGGLGYGSMSMLFAMTLKYVPASLAAMLLYTYPAIVSVLSFFIGDEKYTWQKGLALTVCFSGLFLVLGISFDNVSMLGFVLGLGSALVYSVYIVIGNRLLKNANPLVTTTYVCASAAIIFLVTGVATDSLNWSLPLTGWLSIIGIALLPTIVGIGGFFAGMSYVGATNASIISTLEPIITVLLSVALLNEKITPLQVGGGILILGGIVFLQLWAGKMESLQRDLTLAVEKRQD